MEDGEMGVQTQLESELGWFRMLSTPQSPERMRLTQSVRTREPMH